MDAFHHCCKIVIYMYGHLSSLCLQNGKLLKTPINLTVCVLYFLTIGDIVEGKRCTACPRTSTGHSHFSLEGRPLVIPVVIWQRRSLHNQHILQRDTERASMLECQIECGAIIPTHKLVRMRPPIPMHRFVIEWPHIHYHWQSKV